MRPLRWQPTRLPRPWDSQGKNTGVGCHFLLQCMKVKSESEVAQSCSTLSDPMDCSPPGSSVHGIFQARVLEWGVIAFSPSWCLVCAKCYAKFWRYTWLGLCPIHGSVPGPSITFDWGLVNHVWMNDITIWFCVEHLWFPPWCPISLFSVSFNSCLKDCVIWGQLTLSQRPKAKHVN